MLTDTLHRGKLAYEAQKVVFTCITTSTNDIITWSSAHYISDVLQIGSIDDRGSPRPDPNIPSTTATLINATTNGGITVITSQLQLNASIKYPTCNVICQIDSHIPLRNSTSFQTLLGKKNKRICVWMSM